MRVELDTIAHTYRDMDSGVILPGVTSVLKDCGLIDSQFFDDYSRDRGSLVHQACAMYDLGTLDMDTLDPVLVPYVMAWERFRGESGFVPIDIERVVVNETYHYAGTLDRTGIMNAHIMGGHRYIIDIKSGIVQPWTGVQLWAYQICLTEPHRCAAVELHDDGSYRMVEFKEKVAHIFLAALTVRNWRKNNE